MSEHWIQTHNGRTFDLMEPKVEDVDIETIAFALSNITRFTGHCDFYSVAQHSVQVSYLVPPEHALQALLHDATEAYLGDVSRPLKRLLPTYRLFEERVWAVIAERFAVPAELHPSVKHADYVALMTERRDLFGICAKRWAAELEAIPPCVESIEPVCPERARAQFLHRFSMLSGTGVAVTSAQPVDALRAAVQSLAGLIPVDRIDDVVNLARTFVDVLSKRDPSPTAAEWRTAMIESREHFDGASDGYAAADWVVSRAYSLAARSRAAPA